MAKCLDGSIRQPTSLATITKFSQPDVKDATESGSGSSTGYTPSMSSHSSWNDASAKPMSRGHLCGWDCDPPFEECPHRGIAINWEHDHGFSAPESWDAPSANVADAGCGRSGGGWTGDCSQSHSCGDDLPSAMWPSNDGWDHEKKRAGARAFHKHSANAKIRAQEEATSSRDDLLKSSATSKEIEFLRHCLLDQTTIDDRYKALGIISTLQIRPEISPESTGTKSQLNSATPAEGPVQSSAIREALHRLEVRLAEVNARSASIVSKSDEDITRTQINKMEQLLLGVTSTVEQQSYQIQRLALRDLEKTSQGSATVDLTEYTKALETLNTTLNTMRSNYDQNFSKVDASMNSLRNDVDDLIADGVSSREQSLKSTTVGVPSSGWPVQAIRLGFTKPLDTSGKSVVDEPAIDAGRTRINSLGESVYELNCNVKDALGRIKKMEDAYPRGISKNLGKTSHPMSILANRVEKLEQDLNAGPIGSWATSTDSRLDKLSTRIDSLDVSQGQCETAQKLKEKAMHIRIQNLERNILPKLSAEYEARLAELETQMDAVKQEKDGIDTKPDTSVPGAFQVKLAGNPASEAEVFIFDKMELQGVV